MIEVKDIKNEICLRRYIEKNLVTKEEWDDISTYIKLSEKFIVEFKDKLNLKKIFENQILSRDFIEEFYEKNRESNKRSY
jgi:hypothetical protein